MGFLSFASARSPQASIHEVNMSKSINIVILCGGFGQEIVQQILVDTNNAQQQLDGTISGLKRTVLLGKAGDERVCPALVPIYAKKNAEYLLRALEGCKRLQPLRKHVYFVINDVDKPLFVSEEGSLFAEVSDLGFTTDNIIYNGARKASEWKGQLADFQAALKSIGMALPVVAVSAAVNLLPGYNMQRVIEHSLVRDRDTLLHSTLSKTDSVLFAPLAAARLHSVALADTVVLPPIAEVKLLGQASSGARVAEHLMVLKAQTLPVVSELLDQLQAGPGGGPGGPASELPALAAALLGRGVPVCGVEAGPGWHRLEGARALDYADRFMHYYLWHMQPEQDHPADDDDVAVDDDGILKTTMNALYSSVLEDEAKLAQTASDFDAVYFGGEGETLIQTSGSVLGTTMLKKYKLPSTFYMTQYRRMGADVMR